MTASRRQVLGYAGASGVGVLGGWGLSRLSDDDGVDASSSAGLPRTISPYGEHQPGVATHTARALRLIALDANPGLTRESLGRLMRIWTGDIEAATLGRPAPGDTAADLAQEAVDLTVTVGWGPRLFDALELSPPQGFVRVPAMSRDKLRPEWSAGDLLLRIEADDDTTIAHVARRLLLDAGPFASLRWEQRGSWRGRDARQRPITGRNLFGQIDGTANPAPGTKVFSDTVWIADGEWGGGTTMVLRRIKMRLDSWDAITRHEQETAIGRHLDTGAPFGGSKEDDPLDLDAVDDRGELVIPVGAHARLSHPNENGGRRIFRKGANYVDQWSGHRESGLLFQSFQADLQAQFIPIQAKLDAFDDLNTWTVAVGSAEFAILPGIHPGQWLGQPVLEP